MMPMPLISPPGLDDVLLAANQNGKLKASPSLVSFDSNHSSNSQIQQMPHVSPSLANVQFATNIQYFDPYALSNIYLSTPTNLTFSLHRRQRPHRLLERPRSLCQHHLLLPSGDPRPAPTYLPRVFRKHRRRLLQRRRALVSNLKVSSAEPRLQEDHGRSSSSHRGSDFRQRLGRHPARSAWYWSR